MSLSSPISKPSGRPARSTRRAHASGNFCDSPQRLEPSGHKTSVITEECASAEERFEATFEEHYRAVARYLRTRGHSAADADDLIAATFEVAWRQMDKLPRGREALPWLLAVARNLSRNAHRKSRREASFVDGLGPVTVPWTNMRIEERAASADVLAAVAQLKPVDRDLVLLVAWDELSPAEAGQVLGLRPVTARSRLHRARQRMSALLQESAGPASAAVPASLRASLSSGGGRCES
jgi:RNA polymerase sigma-70 factor, ECF subfamily